MPTPARVVAYSSELTDLTLDHWCDMAAPELSIARRNGPLILPNGHSVITTYPSHLGVGGAVQSTIQFLYEKKKSGGT